MRFALVVYIAALPMGSIWGENQTSDFVRITDSPVEERSPSVSPKQDTLAFLTNPSFGLPYQLGLVDLEEGVLSVITESLNLQDGIGWIDERTVVACDWTDGSGRLISIEVDTREVRTLYASQKRLSFASISTWGSVLFCQLEDSSEAYPAEPNFSLWELDLDSEDVSLLYDSPARDVAPMADSKGNIYFFSRSETEGKSDDLFVYEVSTGRALRILENAGDDFSPTPSPDGEWLVFANNDSGKPSLYLLRLRDRSIIELGNMKLRQSQPTWTSDGSSIYFVAREPQSAADIYRLDLAPILRSNRLP